MNVNRKRQSANASWRIRLDRHLRQIPKLFPHRQTHSDSSLSIQVVEYAAKFGPAPWWQKLSSRSSIDLAKVCLLVVAFAAFLYNVCCFLDAKRLSKLHSGSIRKTPLSRNIQQSTSEQPFLPLSARADQGNRIRPGVSLVAACRNPRTSLEQAYGSWSHAEGIEEIILVDWSSDPPLEQVVWNIADHRLYMVRVLDERCWSRAQAYNLGVSLSSFELTVLVDCGHFLEKNFLDIHSVSVANGSYPETDRFWVEQHSAAINFDFESFSPAILVPRKLFVSVGGYDERYESDAVAANFDLQSRLRSIANGSDMVKQSYKRLDHDNKDQNFDQHVIVENILYACRSKMNYDLVRNYLPSWTESNRLNELQDTTAINASVRKTSYAVASSDANLEPSRRLLKGKSISICVVQRAEPISAIVDSKLLLHRWRLQLSQKLHDDYGVLWTFLTAIEAEEMERLLRRLATMHATNIKRLPRSLRSRALVSPMVLSSVSTPALFVVHVMHGLGNRLRALGSAMAYAAATGRLLVVIWERDEHCGAFFPDLFHPVLRDSSERLFVINEMYVDWPQLTRAAYLDTRLRDWDLYNYMRMEGFGAKRDQEILDNPDRHIYFKSAYVITPASTALGGWHLVNKHLQMLTPVDSIQTITSEHGNQLDLEHTVGIHIRNMRPEVEAEINSTKEYGEDDSEIVRYWREISKPSLFFPEMRSILVDDPATRFFVASDSATAVHDVSVNFPGKVVTVERNGCDSREKVCIQMALADIMLLSRCRLVLGSPWSSFTEAASRFGAHRVRLAGIDFGAESEQDRSRHPQAVANMLTRVFSKRRSKTEKQSE